MKVRNESGEAVRFPGLPKIKSGQQNPSNESAHEIWGLISRRCRGEIEVRERLSQVDMVIQKLIYFRHDSTAKT